MKGKGNRVSFADPAGLSNLTIRIVGDGNTIEVGAHCDLKAVSIGMDGSQQSIRIGAHTTFEDVKIVCNEGATIEIGEDCMFSRGVWIRTSDAHSILDRETGERINRAGSIKIGDHVWIGQDATVGKNVEIASDCVIGFGSFVNRSITEPGVVAAGVPATIRKTGITWDRRRLKQLPPEKHWRHAGPLAAKKPAPKKAVRTPVEGSPTLASAARRTPAAAPQIREQVQDARARNALGRTLQAVLQRLRRADRNSG